MLATSEEILSAWLSPARQLAVRVQVDQSSYGSEDVTSLSFDSGSISGEVYQIGSTYMNTVQIVFPSIIETIKEDQEVIPELGILVDGEYHYSKLGHFFITEFNRDRNAKTTTITASDKMIYMEGVYESKLTYPKPYREVALEIANLAGVEINQASFASLGTLAIRKPVGYTHRQAIGLIAQFEGGFASFNRDGELEIRRLRPTEFEVTPESYLLKGFSKNENAYRIGGITVRIGEEETDVLRVGSTNGSQIELENKVMTQTLLNNIWDLVKNLNYFPFELKWRGCPLLEAGDWMYVADRDGKRYSVPNLSYSLNFNGGLSGDSKATTNSSSQATYKYRGSLKQRVDWLDSLLSSNGWNQNYYDTTEPKNPKEGDIWFKQNGQDKEIWIYEKDADGNLSWVLQVSTATDPELQKAIEEVGEKVEQAQSDAEQALTNANDAVSKATNAAAKADQSSAAATQAQADATMALTGANTAKENAQTALSQSATAIADAKNALDQYAGLSFDNRNLLLNTAVPKELTGTGADNQLRTLANFSKSTFGAYGFEPGKSIAFRATIEITGSGFGGFFNLRMGPNVWASLNPTGQRYPITKTETLTFETVLPIKSTWADNRYVDIRLDGVPTTVNLRITEMQLTYSSQVIPWQRAPEDVQVTIENLGNELQAKVSQTVFDTLNQKVTTQGTAITANTKAIGLKADQTVVETLSGRVTTAEGSITAIAGEVKLKANQTVVDSLTGRVSTAEGSITTLAGKVALKAEKSYVDTVKDTVDSVRSDLTVEAGKVTALNTLTDGHTAQIGNLQSSYDGLSSTVSKVETDLNGKASVTDLANLSITVSTIQTTVANKAEQSQVTQLAGQITSIVSDVSNIKAVGTNLWAPSYYASNQYYIDASGSTVANTTYLSTNHILVGSNKSVMVSVFEYTGATTGRIVVAFYNGTTFISRTQINPNTTTESQVTFPAGTTRIAFSAPIAGRYKFEFGVKATDYSVSPLDTATTSQITQLADRMNFRITNSDGSITQIDLANKVISLSGEQVNITGNTYIANSVIGTAQIKDAAITDAKIGNLSAGKITTGTLNAANVAIINLDVNNLTGNLTNFVKTYWTSAFGSQVAITANAITMVTSKANLSLTANALKLYSADYTGASAVFALGKWRDSSSTQTSATGIYIGSSSAISSNTDFTAFLNRNGASYMLYAESTMNYGSNTNIVKNALNIFGTTHIWGGTTIHDALGIYGYMAFHGGDFARITVDPNAATFNFRIKAGVTDGSYFWFNNKIISSDGWASSSLLSLKNVRKVYEGDALSEICKTDIVEYSYKNRPNDVELSPIIDDVHRTPEYYLPDIITDGKTVNMYAMSSLTWVAIKQLNQKIEELERKLSA